MTSITFSEVSRSVYLTTLTSGLIPLIAISAESTLFMPTRSTVWTIWRCRFETSTVSASMMPMVPTPAAAR